MLESVFNEIISSISEDEVNDRTVDCMEDFLPEDWDTEFLELTDAYEEQGRGQAESQVIRDIINARCPNIPDEEFCDLFDALAEHWDLSTS